MEAAGISKKRSVIISEFKKTKRKHYSIFMT